jgi:ABC-type Mn2+/Zn2+ transport system permease subunit
VNARSLRLLTAASFLIGFACFVGGIAIEFSESMALGTSLIGVGALAMSVSSFVARRRGLPAP